MLSRMAARAEDLAAAFHAQSIAALKAGDLDRAGQAETRFNSLFLGIRRAVALKARLRQQREETRHKAETHKDRRQDGKDRRRHAVAQGLSQAIAVVSPEVHERFTADLWERLTENDRIDADLADTALPVEALIRRLGRLIGLADSAIAYGLDPALAKARADRAAAQAAWGPAAAAGDDDDDDPDDAEEEPGTESAQYCYVPAADLGLPGDGSCRVRVDTGEVFDDDDNLVMTLPVPDTPWQPGAADFARVARAARPASTPPPGPPPPVELDPEEAEFLSRAAYAKQHSGIELIMPPALKARVEKRRRERAAADGGSGNRNATDKRP
ncbi:MAG: hypothetical protein ACRC67_15535 [Inquilinus sp.]|uniref:hypothetical protein n=1 Tax=Inquilinus sp. TaxID=1932117 RepID=UPI003F343643